MAEERRLFYVGVTRAKRRLYLVHCFRRSMWGDSSVQEPSRFLDEIPAELLSGMVDKHGRREAGYKRMTAWESDDASRSPRSQTGGQWSGRSKSGPPAWGQTGKPANQPPGQQGPAKNAYWTPGGSDAGSSIQRRPPSAASTNDTTGLKWAPETGPIIRMIA